MDLREVLNATGSLAPPGQQPPGLVSRDLYRRHGHGNPQNHACVYCRRSHMSCDLGRPCTRCIKRNIGHLCHDERFDTGLQKGKSTQPGQTAQTNTTSLPNSNLEICHYTISRDHTGGAEDQKCEILADFARKHTRAWTNISLANINSPIANPETSPEGLRSLYGPGHYATHSELLM
ncbi:uncharacterized protein FFB20_14784 [Fusarium fujikuroi]|nr:uncharacterized protein FFB20_14784 [Fusarium fujikuroi]SCO26039.1 uncharacterized protein FFC1_15805 [Fusarium fujikuroi]SCO35451.1 uncharacterized protein FFNC_04467 [Fusarium fujikuroi]SCO36083.1 uncharacterized protein FFMR_03931 [Fusarium fujikuroi]SCV36900.1 uncharacterized protein FFFS_05419 [Fusarium fujikuroi]